MAHCASAVSDEEVKKIIFKFFMQLPAKNTNYNPIHKFTHSMNNNHASNYEKVNNEINAKKNY